MPSILSIITEKIILFQSSAKANNQIISHKILNILCGEKAKISKLRMCLQQ